MAQDTSISYAQEMWDFARCSTLCQDLHLECADVLEQHRPDIWCAARQRRVRVGADVWLDYAGSFADVLCSELQAYSEKILQGETKPLRGNVDRLAGGNATTQITDFLLALKTVDRFAATSQSMLLQVPSFPCKLTMDKRTSEYAARLNKWLTQLQTLKHAFDEHMRTAYNGTNVVQPPVHQDLSHLGLEGRDVMLLMEYQTHALQEHWTSVASLVDGLGIFIRSLLLHEGAMSDTYLSRLYRVMQQNGLASSVSAVLGARRLKRRLTDWKAAFGAAVFISPLIIFCGKGLGQVCALTGTIKAGSRVEALGKPLTVWLVEREAWRCIIGVAAGMWDSEFGLAQFLDGIADTIDSLQARADENFFQQALNDVQQYKLELEHNMSESNRRWLQESLPAWRQECTIKAQDGLYVKNHRRSRSVDSVDRSLWTQLFVPPMVHTEDDSEEDEYVTAEEESDQTRRAAQRVSWQRGRRASIVFLLWEEERHVLHCETDDLKTFQPEMPVLHTPLPKFGVVTPHNEVNDGDKGRKQDGEYEQDVGVTLTQKDMLTVNLDLLGRMSSLFALGDGLNIGDMEIDIDPPTVEELRQEIHVSEELEEAETDDDESPFVLKMSRAERKRHLEKLNRDNTLEKEWHMRLLHTRSCSMGPARKVLKLDSTCYECSQEALVFPDCYVPSMDRVTTLQVFGLQCTFEDDQKTVAGYLACVAAGALCVKSSDSCDSYATPMVAKGNLESRGLVLNALFLPMPEKPLEEPQCVERAMSQSTVFNQTREMPSDIFKAYYPKPTTTFALASMAATFSYIHLDSMGVGMVVQVLTGKKIWFLFHRRGTVVPNGYIEEFFNDWKPGFIPDSDAWDADMLVLEPGTLLFMRPNTHHAVITLEKCIVSGQHFYVSSCIEDTVVGFVHTCMWDFFITNVVHKELCPLLLRMMCYFAQVICSPSGPSDVHCLDVSTHRGLLDVVALGNFCIFATALNGKNEEQHKDGVRLAVNCYKHVIRVASRDFVLYFSKGEQEVTPFQLAQTSAKHFAAALIIYLKRVADTQCESAEAVDDPLDLECFETGALTVLKELFDVSLSREEIESLATKSDLRLLWRFLFIVQRKGEAFNQQLWDAQWEAMRQEADSWNPTSLEGSSGNNAH
ncbi:hypothetical protein EDD85DRAFT_947492 [Armillaria nabsnona]|nr:hypothetical protein EDD85DRAFT_947492 [Armillaria nabsnona]